MKIAGCNLDSNVFVIAEVGNNHEGDFSLAKELVRLAAETGADAVKFQTIVPERLVRPQEVERLAQLRRFSFTYEQFQELKDEADRCGIHFLSTPFDVESARRLAPMVQAFKVASGDNNFFPMIDFMCSTGKPLIISTGLSDLSQVRQTRDFVTSRSGSLGQSSLVLLHCVSGYPVPYDQANLQAIAALKELHPYVGYSDHTLGIEAAVAAVALGARVIEKHFTISKSHSSFRDHALSAEPQELADMVARIKQVNLMSLHRGKTVQESERDNLLKARRSVCAAVGIDEGTTLTLDHLAFLRPGEGISPDQVEKVIGRVTRRAFEAGEPLTFDAVE